jgi:hypothetical protein
MKTIFLILCFFLVVGCSKTRPYVYQPVVYQQPVPQPTPPAITPKPPSLDECNKLSYKGCKKYRVGKTNYNNRDQALRDAEARNLRLECLDDEITQERENVNCMKDVFYREHGK